MRGPPVIWWGMDEEPFYLNKKAHKFSDNLNIASIFSSFTKALVRDINVLPPKECNVDIVEVQSTWCGYLNAFLWLGGAQMERGQPKKLVSAKVFYPLI